MSWVAARLVQHVTAVTLIERSLMYLWSKVNGKSRYYGIEAVRYHHDVPSSNTATCKTSCFPMTYTMFRRDGSRESPEIFCSITEQHAESSSCTFNYVGIEVLVKPELADEVIGVRFEVRISSERSFELSASQGVPSLPIGRSEFIPGQIDVYADMLCVGVLTS